MNKKLILSFEEAVGMPFVDILHKGHWGNEALCATRDGTVYAVNRTSKTINIAKDYTYSRGSFVINDLRSHQMNKKRILALIVTSPFWIVFLGVTCTITFLIQGVIYGFTGEWKKDWNYFRIITEVAK